MVVAVVGRIHSRSAVIAERINGSFVAEEKPADELMSDMLPVNRRQSIDDDHVAAAAAEPTSHDDDDDDDDDDYNDVLDSHNGKTFLLKFSGLWISG